MPKPFEHERELQMLTCPLTTGGPAVHWVLFHEYVRLEVQRDELAEALRPFVLHFEYHLAQARKGHVSFPDPIGEGLQITEKEIVAARAALVKLKEVPRG